MTAPDRPTAPTLGARLFVAMQYCIPQHLVSRVVLRATRSRTPWFRDRIVRSFVRSFRPDMSDAVETDPARYASFNEFFTRALRPGARPIACEPGAIACPVDGTVSQAGAIADHGLLQAKGFHYSLDALLAGRHDWAARFSGGTFATIYLAPYNYHRIHMPLAGTLRDAWYVPGRLFSVNDTTAQAVPRLFARNERVVLCFEREGMPFAVILVGALNVGSMATVWHGDVTPRRPRQVTRLPLDNLAAPPTLDVGAELGRFNMGSTVILLFPPGGAEWASTLVPRRVVRVGERIGSVRGASA